ncbi:MAG: hypothetical protein K2Q32_04625 [Alphaproteobacteria bacterium]|nr:hypothetical protein [Alphaproteobacteria bacterium]
MFSSVIAELDPRFLLEQLQATDAFATENVRNGGGPFGAALHIIDLDTNQTYQIGSFAANAVLQTGIASQHAEAEVLSPNNQRALREKLTDLRSQNRTNLAVVCTSSGQSCPACQAKQEIVARDLAIDGLLPKGRFVNTFGATFEDTASIASFNDAPYVLDNLLRLLGTDEPLMVKVEHRQISELPQHIQKKFLLAEADGRNVAVLEGTNVTVKANDNRKHDLFATAGVQAIRDACSEQNKMSKDGQAIAQPWLLGNRPESPNHHAILYTSIKNAGPLLLAEAQWAGVSRIVCINGLLRPDSANRETPDVSNHAFSQACWSGYNRTDSYLTVIRLMPFDNDAQHEWQAKLMREGNACLYNGLSGKSHLLRMTDEMRVRFTGHTIFCNTPNMRHNMGRQHAAKL